MYKEIVTGILIGFLFISLIVLFCLLLIRLYIKKIKEHNQKEIAFQKTLKKTIIETQEQVVNNISQDLHDDAGQQLTSINFQLENLKLDSPELEKILTPVSKSLRQLSQSIRSISHSLNHNVILQSDFTKVMDNEVKRLRKNKKLTVNYSFEELSVKSFSENERIFIYRIFQECINNCLKHSKCNKIDIHIRTAPHFEMIFSDNGIGFDSTIISSGEASLGFMSMKERANDINYSLIINSTIGEGTNILLSESKPS